MSKPQHEPLHIPKSSHLCCYSFPCAQMRLLRQPDDSLHVDVIEFNAAIDFDSMTGGGPFSLTSSSCEPCTYHLYSS